VKLAKSEENAIETLFTQNKSISLHWRLCSRSSISLIYPSLIGYHTNKMLVKNVSLSLWWHPTATTHRLVQVA